MANQQARIQHFQQRYQLLNARQREAVDTIEGPVIVNAGPGTGKTQILAMRIGRILLETDTAPTNILCLTYTDNGAVEMRTRLLEIAGTAAYNIRIHTFHSFCNEVIQDNLSYFGKLNLEPIDSLEEMALFTRLVDSIETDSPLKRFRGDVYYEIPRLKALFGLMKKEAWTVAYFNERIDDYLGSLPQREGFFYKKKYKTFNAGDPNPNKIAAETEKMEMLRAAIQLYPRYNRFMLESSRYTFDDMILWVLDAFEKNPSMLLDYQERFLYFLVDEFQDTSRSQGLLLQHLINYWDTPNVFVVGDADQSIFSFQDANVENIIEFEKRFAGSIKKIDLENNYRSVQSILTAAHGLISHNSLRVIENDKPLHAANTTLLGKDLSPAIVEYPNTTHESMDIAGQIAALVAKGVSGKEIAVIYRNHAQVEPISAILEQKKIAVNTRKKVDILQLPFIRNIISILQWINRENTIPYSGEDLLFKILHFNFFAIQPADVARLSMRVNEKNLGRKEDRYTIRKELGELPFLQGNLFEQANNTLATTGRVLEDLLKESNNTIIPHLVEKLIQKAGVLQYIMNSVEKPWLMQVLNAFFGFIKDACKKNPDITLHQLLNDIETMKANRIAIPLNKVTATDEGVNLVTAHSSKGSEYGHVFVIGCTDKVWDDSNKGNNRIYSYPDNLSGDHHNTGNDLEESRRLFYVAITRAKTNLHISYALKDKNDKPLVKSTFVTELLEGMNWQAEKRQVPDEQLIDYLTLQFAETARPEIQLVEETYISQLLARYTLSVTHLSNYLNCPLRFYYQNLIKVPAAKNESMVFGSAVHFALQRLFEKMKQNGDLFPPKEDFLNNFTWYMQKNRDAFTPESYATRVAYGEKILPPYYDTHIHNWNRIVVTEKNIRNVQVQGVPINGKLDKIEFTGRQATVVDYKTGKYENARKKILPPNEKQPDGGDYWRQAVFYKILLDNDASNNWQAESTLFEFIEPVNDTYLTERVPVSPEDMTTVKQQISTVWNKIQQREFKTGCGKPDCEWCQFVKTNQMAVALHYLNEDETDV